MQAEPLKRIAYLRKHLDKFVFTAAALLAFPTVANSVETENVRTTNTND